MLRISRAFGVPNMLTSTIFFYPFFQSVLPSISEFKFRASHICVVLIDDCRDIDIPLAEVSLGNVAVDYRLMDLGSANGKNEERRGRIMAWA